MGAASVLHERGCVVNGRGQYRGSPQLPDGSKCSTCNATVQECPPCVPPVLSAPVDESATIAQAAAAASLAEVAVVVLGLCGNNEGMRDPDGMCTISCPTPTSPSRTCALPTETEAHDRADLLLPGAQLELLKAVHATGTPTVLVLINAGPIDISWAKENVDAIIWAGYGGQSGGTAVVDALLGVSNPGGALPYTVLPQRFAELADFGDMGMRPNASSGNPGRTYRFLDTTKVAPLWQFGFGLSYTTFAIAFVESVHRATPLAPTEASEWAVRVENTGAAVGDVVVICFVAAVKQDVVEVPPIRSAFAFERVEGLHPGARTTLNFTLSARGRALANEAGQWVTPAGSYSVQCEAGGVAKTAAASVTVAATHGE